MGYPACGKVKNVVLPVPTTATSIKQYKEKYGIDLSEFIYLDDGNIHLKKKDNTILYWNISEFLKSNAYEISSIIPIDSAGAVTQYEANVNPSFLSFYLVYYSEDDDKFVPFAAITLSIASDVEFSLDNLKIFMAEV